MPVEGSDDSIPSTLKRSSGHILVVSVFSYQPEPVTCWELAVCMLDIVFDPITLFHSSALVSFQLSFTAILGRSFETAFLQWRKMCSWSEYWLADLWTQLQNQSSNCHCVFDSCVICIVFEHSYQLRSQPVAIKLSLVIVSDNLYQQKSQQFKSVGPFFSDSFLFVCLSKHWWWMTLIINMVPCAAEHVLSLNQFQPNYSWHLRCFTLACSLSLAGKCLASRFHTDWQMVGSGERLQACRNSMWIFKVLKLEIYFLRF